MIGLYNSPRDVCMTLYNPNDMRQQCSSCQIITAIASMDADEILGLFGTLTSTSDVQHRPIGGTIYLYAWTDSSKKG